MNSGSSGGKLFLGIEGTAAGTTVMLADEHAQMVRRLELGPGHLKLFTGARLCQFFHEIAGRLPRPNAIGAALAGAGDDSAFARIHSAAHQIWPRTPCRVASIFDIARASVVNWKPLLPWVVTAAGSTSLGKGPRGKTAQVGGWGHLLGDKASAGDIGLRAVKAVLYRYDKDGMWPLLGRRILRCLQLNEPEDLVAWATSATASEIRQLGAEVLLAWHRDDRIATDIVAGAAASLAWNAAACARRVAGRNDRVEFLFAPGVLLQEASLARLVNQELRRLWRKAKMTWSDRDTVWGAIELARLAEGNSASQVEGTLASFNRLATTIPLPRSAKLSPTEQRHPCSMNLDRMPLREAIRLMLAEDAKIPGRLLAERRQIERAVRLIASAFRKGGRLFYVGAGTSGRLGVLDASECPPTFRSEPEMVQGIIAGGVSALWQAVEGAEDDAPAGALALHGRGLRSHDVVVGLAASGTTPFVWGALNFAIRRGAGTILICFNPHLVIPGASRPDVVIAPNLGPEVLTGSTRLKAGTATKLLLNLFTTLSMVRIGKVISNLMVHVLPSNAKLRDRAVRIVQELAQLDYDSARQLLEQKNWNIRNAVSRRGRR